MTTPCEVHAGYPLSPSTTMLKALYVLKRLLYSFFTPERANTWRTICTAASFRYTLDRSDFLSSMPSSLTNYLQWTESHNLPATFDELPDGAYLLWIGPKRTDRVILYCHGGAYMMSCPGSVMTFCRYLQLELAQRNIHTGIAILAYKLLPKHPFPTQLHEASSAITAVLGAGADITLAGASAGGNLVLQLLTHILHPLPLPTVPPLPPTRFRGVFLMSPWVAMQEDLHLPQDLLEVKHRYDSMSAHYGRLACRTLLRDLPSSLLPFVDPLEAPEDWFSGISELAERVFVMWGEVECLREGQRRLCERYLEPWHPRMEVYEQPSGIHCQPIWDSAWMGNVGEPRIVEWFARLYASEITALPTDSPAT